MVEEKIIVVDWGRRSESGFWEFHQKGVTGRPLAPSQNLEDGKGKREQHQKGCGRR